MRRTRPTRSHPHTVCSRAHDRRNAPRAHPGDTIHHRARPSTPLPESARRRRAFTLIEVLVAVVITGGVAGATAIAVSQSLKAKTGSRARQEASARANVAAERIALDIQNTIRDADLYYAQVSVVDKDENALPRDEILLFVRSLRQARPTSEQAEGGEYEVQYRTQVTNDPAVTRRLDRSATGVLWRRVDPIPDETPDGGGVAFPIVEGVTALSVEAFDGESWLPEWYSDRDGYPHAVRLIVTAVDDRGRTSATVRKVVALDRPPPTHLSDRPRR